MIYYPSRLADLDTYVARYGRVDRTYPRRLKRNKRSFETGISRQVSRLHKQKLQDSGKHVRPKFESPAPKPTRSRCRGGNLKYYKGNSDLHPHRSYWLQDVLVVVSIACQTCNGGKRVGKYLGNRGEKSSQIASASYSRRLSG
jgi:hypothetical protein